MTPLLYGQGQTAALPNGAGAQPTLSLRVAGSSVMDVNGEMSGNVESVVVNPQTGQIQFALVSTEYPANRLNVTPIPWQMLRYRSSGGIPGTFQQLGVPVARGVLMSAPRITSEQSAAADGTAWMNTSTAFFQTAASGARFNAAAGEGVNPFFANGPGQTQPTNGFGFGTNAAGATGQTNLAGNNSFAPTNTFGGTRAPTNLPATTAGANTFPTNAGVQNPPGTFQGAIPNVPPANVGAPPNDSGVSTPTLPQDVVPPNKQPLTPAPAVPARPATPLPAAAPLR